MATNSQGDSWLGKYSYARIQYIGKGIGGPTYRDHMTLQILVGSLPETNIASDFLPLEKEIPIGRHHF